MKPLPTRVRMSCEPKRKRRRPRSSSASVTPPARWFAASTVDASRDDVGLQAVVGPIGRSNDRTVVNLVRAIAVVDSQPELGGGPRRYLHRSSELDVLRGVRPGRNLLRQITVRTSGRQSGSREHRALPALHASLIHQRGRICHTGDGTRKDPARRDLPDASRFEAEVGLCSETNPSE